MKLTQTQTATTTLDSSIIVGEINTHQMSAKPGNYNVYDVKEEDGIETILLFVHEDEAQDINDLLPQMQFHGCGSIGGGTYGIINQEHADDRDYWIGRLSDYNNQNPNCKDGYVSYTNHGDGSFVLYTNPEHSVFLLDDVDMVWELFKD